MTVTRRSFLEGSSLAALAAMTGMKSFAAGAGTGPLGRPIGLQLYTVREEAGKDLLGTLKKLQAIGYREVETAGFYGKSGKELRKILADHGLTAPSAHSSMSELQKGVQPIVDGAAEVGAKYLICAFPSQPGNKPAYKAIAKEITLDDWQWNAEQLNKLGEAANKAGLQAGYHNHNMEFRSYNGVIAFDELLKWTDPKLVTIELDLAWVVTAGLDPVKYLKEHANRISLLHVKDVRKDAVTTADELKAQTVEVGRGKIDWKRIFAACDPQYLKHYFVEQENFTGSTI
ncbi:sugar phosphate isomerase/epimerase family protein, partial [Steroidobacter sp.]|uniref:sugar phosphate isomerase/epimerase family protein n=1 Tax=Steroidobacter sp. TaxID=1978227 RepID=UPI001A54C2EF